MAGHKSLLEAVKAGDVQIIEMSRGDARAYLDGADINEVTLGFDDAMDEAQGQADEEGKAVYIVLKINGGPI